MARASASRSRPASPAGQRARLIGERALQFGEHARVVVEALLVQKAGALLALANQIPRRHQQRRRDHRLVRCLDGIVVLSFCLSDCGFAFPLRHDGGYLDRC